MLDELSCLNSPRAQEMYKSLERAAALNLQAPEKTVTDLAQHDHYSDSSSGD
jgi:hypothetical protein